MGRRIALACDHGGLRLKEFIRRELAERGIVCVDFGTDSTASVDYPDYARAACEAVVAGECDFGLLFCTTGVGMSIAANKIHGIRACCCSDAYSAAMTRRHNKANVLCMGQNVVGEGLALVLVEAFLAAEFDMENPRHARRVEKLARLEEA